PSAANVDLTDLSLPSGGDITEIHKDSAAIRRPSRLEQLRGGCVQRLLLALVHVQRHDAPQALSTRVDQGCRDLLAVWRPYRIHVPGNRQSCQIPLITAVSMSDDQFRVRLCQTVAHKGHLLAVR